MPDAHELWRACARRERRASALLGAGQLAALVLFALGFFLARLELGDRSPCDPTALLDAYNVTRLWAPDGRVGRADRASGAARTKREGLLAAAAAAARALVIVDALRWDFAAPRGAEGLAEQWARKGFGAGGGGAAGAPDAPAYAYKLATVARALDARAPARGAVALRRGPADDDAAAAESADDGRAADLSRLLGQLPLGAGRGRGRG